MTGTPARPARAVAEIVVARSRGCLNPADALRCARDGLGDRWSIDA